jgi:hypothetical protein
MISIIRDMSVRFTRTDEGTMLQVRRLFGTAALFSGLLLVSPAMAQEPKADDIANKMSEVVDSLGRKQTGKPVQGEQTVIVRELDELIASLEKRAQALRAGIKQNRPTRGMADSMISSGNGQIGDLVDPNEGGKDWAKLSDRERDRILQSMTEGFPPEYRTVLERYYRRLAEEKTAKAAGEGAKTKATASAEKR